MISQRTANPLVLESKIKRFFFMQGIILFTGGG